MALDVVDRSAKIAALVGASPLPIADMWLLTPLQVLMVSVVGGLSCRSFTVETAGEYLTASGVTAATGFACAKWPGRR